LDEGGSDRSERLLADRRLRLSPDSGESTTVLFGGGHKVALHGFVSAVEQDVIELVLVLPIPLVAMV
jgi:hypothetical protein